MRVNLSLSYSKKKHTSEKNTLESDFPFCHYPMERKVCITSREERNMKVRKEMCYDKRRYNRRPRTTPSTLNRESPSSTDSHATVIPMEVAHARRPHSVKIMQPKKVCRLHWPLNTSLLPLTIIKVKDMLGIGKPLLVRTEMKHILRESRCYQEKKNVPSEK